MIPSTGDIRIDIDGLWFYRSIEMSRRDIVRLFYRHLVKDESGRYYIQMKEQRYPVEVEDTAYIVWSLLWIDSHKGGEECIHLLLSDDSVEILALETLRIGRNGVPYCRVKNGSFDARFSRSSYNRLAEHIQYDPQRSDYFVMLGKRRYYIAEDGR
jgi:uncharacterized protein